MKFTPIYNKKHRFAVSDRASFSTDDYTCMFILQTMKGQPVAIFHNTEMDIWKVQYGFSTVFFGTYDEAMQFCRKRFCEIPGEKARKRK